MSHLGKIIFLLVLYIGTFCGVLNAAVVEPDPEVLAKEHKVFVEPTYVEVTKTQSEFKLQPYSERRHTWGFNASFGYSTYEPENYEPAFGGPNYKTVYGRPTIGTVEAIFSFKRNMPGFSFGLDLGVASFRNDHSDDTYVGSVLNFIEGRIGGVLYADSIFGSDQWVVPYVAGGGYMMFYKENLLGNEFGGTTQVAPYVNGGLAMVLDWIDPHAARIGYEQSSVQRSYFYVEARKYFISNVKKDPDFSNTVSGGAGVRVEF